MKLLLILKDEDIGIKSRKIKMEKRLAARAVLSLGGKIALLNVTKDGYHKLPGGGVEEGENIKQALLREILEETGCTIEIMKEVGKIIEHRTHEGILREKSGVNQTSYCYTAKVIKKGHPKFDEGEMEAGYQLEWVDLNSAISMLQNEKPSIYEGKFIVRRDLALLEATKDLLQQ